MLLANTRHKEVPYSPSRTPFHTPLRRNSHTAKTNTRLSTPNATRTISLKPDHPSRISPSIRMNHSSQLFPNEQPVGEVPEAFGKLDRVQLQDFLKMVIVGDTKVAGDRSNQIIRSLNGTWFKNTQAQDSSSFRFFSSLGVKRTRQQNRLKQPFTPVEGHEPSDLLKKDYSPPNRFPAKKSNWKKSTPIKIDVQYPSNLPLDITSTSPLTARVQRTYRSQNKSSRTSFKRSFSQFQKTKKGLLVATNKELSREEGLTGKRMILYKD